MGRETIEEAEQYRLEWDDELDTVLYTWKQFVTDEQFKQGANAILEHFENNDVSKLIVDTSTITAHDEEDQQWLEEEWTPAVIEAGMEYNCVVYPESTIAEMDRRRIQEQLSNLPYDALWTDSMEEAREWMAER